MNSPLKMLIDGAIGAALFVALLLVFGLELLIGLMSGGTGKNTLEGVRPVLVERSHGSKKLKLGVTETGQQPNPSTGELEKYDDMGKLLKELGSGYKFDELKIADLVANPKKIYEYEVVFLTCHTGHEEQLRETLRNYVMEGGILYGSDLRYNAIAKAFPEEVAKHLEGQGHPQILDADIVDPGLREYLTADPELAKHLHAGKLRLKFDLGEWRPAAFDSPRTKVLLKGNYKKLTRKGQPDQGSAVAPLMVKFQIGKGTVIFTSFHNEKQNSEIEKKLLQYLVFSLVTAGVDAELNAKLEKGGFAAQRSSLLSAPSRNQKITKEYKNERVADLQFALGFREDSGAKLKFKIISPDGKHYTWEGTSTVILEVPGAQAGLWRYEVIAEDLPDPNFPFIVTVGEKK